MPNTKIIPANNARAMIRAGNARCETLVYDEHRGKTYMCITNLRAQITQHYLVGDGRIDADQLSAADRSVYQP